MAGMNNPNDHAEPTKSRTLKNKSTKGQTMNLIRLKYQEDTAVTSYTLFGRRLVDTGCMFSMH